MLTASRANGNSAVVFRVEDNEWVDGISNNWRYFKGPVGDWMEWSSGGRDGTGHWKPVTDKALLMELRLLTSGL